MQENVGSQKLSGRVKWTQLDEENLGMYHRGLSDEIQEV